MGKSFFFSQNPISRRVDTLESTVDDLYTISGITPHHRHNASRVLDTLRAGRHAEMEAGQATANGKQYEVDHVEVNGDVREIYMHRKNESGFYENVKAVEERTGNGTFLAKELRHV